MAEGGWPTQASLFKGGLADSPLCTACSVAEGTLYHRVRMCSCTSWLRQAKDSEAAGIIGPARAGEEDSNSLLRRGIPVRPDRTPPPPCQVCTEVGAIAAADEDDFVFTGDVGSDGSMKVVRPVMARRAGWGAVAAGPAGELLLADYGSCPDRCPTAHRAELWGILMVVRRGRLPLCIHTDHCCGCLGPR